jgi:hypothetical protein
VDNPCVVQAVRDGQSDHKTLPFKAMFGSFRHPDAMEQHLSLTHIGFDADNHFCIFSFLSPHPLILTSPLKKSDHPLQFIFPSLLVPILLITIPFYFE